jgi:large subunit ribosomal protein L15
MKLHEIRDNPGAHKTFKRRGRGIGSGKGKTGGRGVKGQKARAGVALKGFEGGQMPIHMRIPKRGFNNPERPVFAELNLDTLQEAIDEKRLTVDGPITAESLIEAGVIRRAKDGVKLLGRGRVKGKLELEVARASASAIAAVEKAGGSVKVLAPRAAPAADA